MEDVIEKNNFMDLDFCLMGQNWNKRESKAILGCHKSVLGCFSVSSKVTKVKVKNI